MSSAELLLLMDQWKVGRSELRERERERETGRVELGGFDQSLLMELLSSVKLTLQYTGAVGWLVLSVTRQITSLESPAVVVNNGASCLSDLRCLERLS